MRQDSFKINGLKTAYKDTSETEDIVSSTSKWLSSRGDDYDDSTAYSDDYTDTKAYSANSVSSIKSRQPIPSTYLKSSNQEIRKSKLKKRISSFRKSVLPFDLVFQCAIDQAMNVEIKAKPEIVYKAKQFIEWLNREKTLDNLKLYCAILDYEAMFRRFSRKFVYADSEGQRNSYSDVQRKLLIEENMVLVASEYDDVAKEMTALAVSKIQHQEMRKLLVEIFNRYIREGSSDSIDLPIYTRNNLEFNVFSDDCSFSHPQVFKEVKEKIITVMRKHAYTHFERYLEEQDRRFIETMNDRATGKWNLAIGASMMLVCLATFLALVIFTPRSSNIRNQFTDLKFRRHPLYWCRSLLLFPMIIAFFFLYAHFYKLSTAVFFFGARVIHDEERGNNFSPSIIREYRTIVLEDLLYPSIIQSIAFIGIALIFP
jgi:hypothetical protein